MDREQVEEFEAIRVTAYNGLRFGTHIDSGRSLPLCQLLILPSFENAIAWDVIPAVARGAETRLRLYRSCWRMDIDQHALSSPVERLKHPRPYPPTIETELVLIELTRVKSLLSRLNAIPIPLSINNPPIGCDGTNFELSVGTAFCNSRIGWWSHLPDEWLELRPVIQELEQFFVQAWKLRAESGKQLP